jgi:hypothetical protein
MNRIGQLTSRQIVIVVLAILGFIIAMGFLFYIFNQEQMNSQELCHLSLLERATAPIVAGAIPIQCTTGKICITSESGGECKEFAGESDVQRIRVDIGEKTEEQVKARKKIEEVNANAFYDCWRMTGGGRLDIFGHNDGENLAISLADKAIRGTTGYFSEEIRPKCIVCSRVAIGEDIYKAKGGKETLESINVNRYLREENVPGSSRTYLETFSGGENLGGYAEFAVEEAVNGTKDFKGIAQIAYVFMQIKVSDANSKEEYWTNFNSNLIVGGAAALTPAGSVITKVFGPWGWLIKGAGIAAVSYKYASKTEETIRGNQLIAAGACGEFQTRLNEKQGCSLTKAVEWDADIIRNLCSGGIKGNL